MFPGTLGERRRSQTRQEIAEAAIKLFRADGYEAVSMEAIAAEAGVSLRTLYRYCNRKDEILSPLVDGESGRLARLIAARPPEEGLAVAVSRAYTYMSEEAGPGRVHDLISLIVEVPALRARWLDDLRRIEATLVPVIVDRSAGGSEDRARLTAATIVAALRLTLEGSARPGSSAPLDGALADALAFIQGGAGL